MRRFSKPGFALAFALALFPLLLVLGLAFMSMSGGDYGFSGQAATRMRAFYLADSGARYAYQERARWRGALHSETWSLATGDVRVVTQPLTNGTILISSWGRSGWSTMLVSMVVDTLPPTNGQIEKWQQQGAVW